MRYRLSENKDSIDSLERIKKILLGEQVNYHLRPTSYRRKRNQISGVHEICYKAQAFHAYNNFKIDKVMKLTESLNNNEPDLMFKKVTKLTKKKQKNKSFQKIDFKSQQLKDRSR